jgi:hypothetical protein
MNDFLGRPTVFWTGIEAIAVCAYTILVVLSLWLIYRQVRIAAKSFQLEAMRSLQQLVDGFRNERTALFAALPITLALNQEQFPNRAPARRRLHRVTDAEVRRMELTPEQRSALDALPSETVELAKRVIGKLNDIGELVEDGFVRRQVFLGKYHVMIIQCCHLVEAIRRAEERRRGGNYGQRLLRMRQWATAYNDVWPKHRDTSIDIACGGQRKTIYKTPTPTMFDRLRWTLRRWLSWYG